MDKIYLVIPEQIGTVAPEIYGTFAEHIGGVIYSGIYCGEDANAENIRGFRKMIIDKLKQANIPLIRWPGGCFAEVYDWRDGIGPKEDRPVRISWWTNRDGKYEPNLVGTDEFLDFCELCGAQPYIAANITATTPMNIRDWVDYCNSPAGTTTMAKLREKNGHKEPYNVKLWGVGNENWGGGGNMTPEYYAMEYRKYAEIINNAAPGLELIACGANHTDYAWNQALLENITSPRSPRMNMAGIAPHYYTTNTNGTPTDFDEEKWNEVMTEAKGIEDAIIRQWAQVVGMGMQEYGRLCIDEWGCWHMDGTGPSKGEKLWEQQSSMMDAVVSALTLNAFNNHCEKMKLAASAQLVNNLHCMFLADGDHCICTPTYHVFDMYKGHQGGKAIRCVQNNPNCSISASVKEDVLTVTLANTSYKDEVCVNLESLGCKLSSRAQIAVLRSDKLTDHNTFEEPEKVVPTYCTCENFDGNITLAPGSVAAITVSLIK